MTRCEKIAKILETEYCPEFDELRKKHMILGYFKYGPLKRNAGEKLVDEIASLELRLKRYKETGNKAYLIDIANFAMMEFMHPQHPNAHYKPTDSDQSPGLVGMSIKEIENFKNGF